MKNIILYLFWLIIVSFLFLCAVGHVSQHPTINVMYYIGAVSGIGVLVKFFPRRKKQ